MLTRADIDKELRRINESIPASLKQNVAHEVDLTPSIALVMAKALESPNISAEKKEEIRTLQERGYFNRKKVTENPKIAQMIENFINREVKKSVAAGRLPTKKQLAIIIEKENAEKQKGSSAGSN